MNQRASRMLRTVREYFGLLYFAGSGFTKSAHEKIPVFVLGCQRSGTSMILKILEHYPECLVCHEGNSFLYNSSYRIRYDIRIKYAIEKSDKKIIVFKPLNDMQHTDRFFNLHTKVKAIWIYRNYHDVANSAVEKWGHSHKNIMNSISKGNFKEHPGHITYQERMKPETLEQVKMVFKKNMSYEDGAALLWYVRNKIYFDLSLDKDHRVLLIKYEDLVANPIQHFKTIFDFISCPFNKEYVKDIHDSSVKKRPWPIIDFKIKCLCDEITGRLSNQYDFQIGNL